MTDLTEKKIKQSIEDRKRTHRRFLDHVKTYKPFLELEEKAFRDGAISKKIKELSFAVNNRGKERDNFLKSQGK